MSTRALPIAVFLAAPLLAAFPALVGAQSTPIAGGPIGLQLHDAHEHRNGGTHLHLGTAADQNGDGWICARHGSPDGSSHLHIDNAVR